MTEIAFLVKPDSEMYRKYFKQKNELDKFVGFASSFIDKYFVSLDALPPLTEWDSHSLQQKMVGGFSSQSR
jgi:hypothetical protein